MLYVQLAHLLEKDKSRYQDTIKYAEKAIEYGYKSADAVLTIARVYMQHNKADDAIKVLNKYASRYDHDKAAIVNERAKAYLMLKKYDAARLAIESQELGRDSYILETLVRINVAEAKDKLSKDSKSDAVSLITKSQKLIEEAENVARPEIFLSAFEPLKAEVKKLRQQLGT